MEEVVADGCESVLANSRAVKQIANEQPELFDGMHGWLKKFFRNVRKAFSKEQNLSQSAKAMTDYMDELTMLWDDALAAAARNKRNSTKQQSNKKTTAKGGQVKYSIRNTSKLSVSEQLKLYYKGGLASSDSFYFGNTPETLRTSGIDNLPLALNQSTFQKCTKDKHNIPRRFIKNLNSYLANSIFSFSLDDTYAFVTEEIDADGKPVIVAIETGVMMDRQPINKITSIYGLDNPAAWINSQLGKGKTSVVYNEKEANSFLQTYGSYIASVEDGIKPLGENISQAAQEVNGETKFSARDTDYIAAVESGDEEQARRLMNEAAREAGYTIHAYHGTARADRVGTVFRPERATSGPMAYFTSDPEIAAHYAEDFLEVMKLAGIDGVEYRDPNENHEKVYDTYLKIQKPFRTENVNAEFAKGLKKWYDLQDKSKYMRETANADMFSR